MNKTISGQPEQYPDDKNPFGDEEFGDDSPEDLSKSSTDKTENQLKTSPNRRQSDALNPFCDDEDIDDNESNSTPKPKPRQSLNVSTPSSGLPSPTSSIRSARKKRPAPTPPTCSTPNIPTSLSNSFIANSGDNSRRDSIISSVSSDLGSLSLQNSRTPTPLPRHRRQKSMEELSNTADNTNNIVNNITVDTNNTEDNTTNNTPNSADNTEANIADNGADITKNSVNDTTDDIEDNTVNNTTNTADNVTNETTDAANDTIDSADNTADNTEDNQQISDKTNESIDTNLSLRITDSDSEQKKSSTSDLRIKKRPAPPIPVVKRIVKGSLVDIEEELNTIGDQLPGIEKKGKELEELLTKRLEDKDNSSCSEEQQQKTVDKKNDGLLDEFLSIARERCRLGRRQKELMYMKREHKLEEIQMDIEYQMRCVISKQAAQKTSEDILKEEELLKRLVEIIEERNDIVENLIRDENKEVEEYQKLISKVIPSTTEPNGALKDDKQAKHKTIDKNFVKFKEKLKLKDSKEKKKSKKLAKTTEKSDICPENGSEPSVKPSEIPKPKSNSSSGKHLTLKSTLKPFRKSLGLKSSSDHKSDNKKSDKTSPVVVVSDDNNSSNASKSDK